MFIICVKKLSFIVNIKVNTLGCMYRKFVHLPQRISARVVYFPMLCVDTLHTQLSVLTQLRLI